MNCGRMSPEALRGKETAAAAAAAAWVGRSRAGIIVVGGKADTHQHPFTPERWGAWTNLRKMMHWRYMFGGAGG